MLRSDESKTIYLAPRHPTLSRDGFRARWRQHGTLAMSLPIWRHASRYMQCDIVPGLDAELGLTPTSDDHWGLGLVWLHNVDALRAMTTERTFPTLYHDELEAFGEYVENFTMLASEAVVRDEGSTQVKLTTFVVRDPGLSRAELWTGLEAWAAAFDDAAPAVKVVLNRPRSVVYVGAGDDRNGELTVVDDESGDSPSRLARYDGALELGFADTAAAAAHVAANSSAVPAELARVLDIDSCLTVATNEIHLYP